MYSLTIRRMLSALTLLSLVVFGGGAFLWWIGEGEYSLPETWYFALISVTTVGFGEMREMDRFPVTRLVTAFLIVAGVGAIAFFQSTLTAMLVEGAIGKAFRRRRMQKQIASMRGHLIVAGCGRTGRYAIDELMAAAAKFVVVDRDVAVLEELGDQYKGKLLYVVGDATHDSTMIESGIEHAAGIIAALTDDRDNLFVTLTARTLNPAIRIVAKVSEAENEPKVTRAGADKTVSPQHIGGVRLASEMVRPQVTEFLDSMLRLSKALRFEQVGVPVGSRYAKRTLRGVPIRDRTNLLVVAVREPGGLFVYNPGPDHQLEPGAELIVMGEIDDVLKLREMMREGG